MAERSGEDYAAHMKRKRAADAQRKEVGRAKRRKLEPEAKACAGDADRIRMSQTRAAMSDSDAEATKTRNTASHQKCRAKRKSDAAAAASSDDEVVREFAKRRCSGPDGHEPYDFDAHADVEREDGEAAIDYGAVYASPSSAPKEGVTSDGDDESETDNGDEGAGSFAFVGVADFCFLPCFVFFFCSHGRKGTWCCSSCSGIVYIHRTPLQVKKKKKKKKKILKPCTSTWPKRARWIAAARMMRWQF